MHADIGAHPFFYIIFFGLYFINVSSMNYKCLKN